MESTEYANSHIVYNNEKVIKFAELADMFHAKQSAGLSIAVIGGCFDVLHMGHIDLFRFAKSHVDLLCVVLDNDKTIQASKGKNRPLFSETIRAEQLAELQSIDLVAIWDEFMQSGSNNTNQLWHDFLSGSRPDFHITNIDADVYWERKKQLCDKLNICFLGYRRERISSSTELMDKMIEHFAQAGF